MVCMWFVCGNFDIFPNLETVININELGLRDTNIMAPKRKNITLAEKEALKLLADNDKIIIKPADMGGAIIIQNKDDYIKEGLRQLSDEKFYIKRDHDMTESHNSSIIEQLEAMRVRGEIREKSARDSGTTSRYTNPEPCNYTSYRKYIRMYHLYQGDQ